MSNNRFEKDAKGLEELIKVLGNQALVVLKEVEEDDGIFTVETSTEGGILPSAMLQGFPRGAKGLKKLLEKGDTIIVVSVSGDKLVTASIPKRENRDQNRSNNNPNNPGNQPNANNNPNPQGQNNPNGGGQQQQPNQPNGQRQHRNNNPGGNQPNPGNNNQNQPNANSQPNPNPQGQNNPNGGGQQPAQTQPQNQPRKGLFERLWTPKVFD